MSSRSSRKDTHSYIWCPSLYCRKLWLTRLHAKGPASQLSTRKAQYQPWDKVRLRALDDTAKSNVDYGFSLIKIEGVDDPKAATYAWQHLTLVYHSQRLLAFSFYLGKKVAFVYRAHKEVRGTKIRVIWGKVTRPHGTQFITNVPLVNDDG